jgi:exodeoxyribonuclease VII large subunit
VRGEIGRLSRPRSGHVYLDLKDDRSVLASVIWKGVAARLAHAPEEGMEVVATGRLTTFPGQSKYQLVIEDLVPAGAGALMAMLERRRAALAAEGLFDEGRKKPLPFLPEVIGVVTSPSGAVIRDILHRLRDRFPRHVLIWPVAVQGAACAPEVARPSGASTRCPRRADPAAGCPDRGARWREPRGPLGLQRGGGGARRGRECHPPDFRRGARDGHDADRLCLGPARADAHGGRRDGGSGALDLLNWVRQQDGYMTRAVRQGVATRRQRLGDLSRGLPRPEMLLDAPRQRLDRAVCSWARRCGRRRRCGGGGSTSCRRGWNRRWSARWRAAAGAWARRGGQLRPSTLRNRGAAERERLNDLVRRGDRALAMGLARRQGRLASLERLHATLGYEATLRRGYAVVHADGMSRPMWPRPRVRRGWRSSSPMASWPSPRRTGHAAARPRNASPPDTPPDQGSLF